MQRNQDAFNAEDQQFIRSKIKKLLDDNIIIKAAAYQEKEKNEKTGKRKAGEERIQGGFKETACYSSTAVQGAERQKNGLCEGECPR